MQPLSSADILELWEQGQRRHAIDRALLVLGAACPERLFEELADLPIGSRDRAILQLRGATFGARVAGYTACEKCGERLEFAVDQGALTRDVTVAPAGATVRAAGHVFRLPTSRDLAGLDGECDPERAIRRLLARCCVSTDTGDVAPSIDDWSEATITEVEARMDAVDGAADLELGLSCAACGHAWQSAFDVVAFFWEEIAKRAQQLLYEIHLLARAYAWPEREILALSDTRRRLYVAMVTQ
jgi:hypothetical protein